MTRQSQPPVRGVKVRGVKATFAILLAAALAGAAVPARAEADGCASFDWPLAVEKQWLTGADLPSYASGSTPPDFPAKGLTVKLSPIREVTFPAALEKPATSGWGGFVVLPSPGEPGLYQITLSHKAWIDVIQGGARLASQAHTGRPDCAVMHKSVRFQLGSGPVTIQFSGAAGDTLKIAVRKAADD